MTASIILVLLGVLLLVISLVLRYSETINNINIYIAERVLKTMGILFIVIGVIVFAMTLAVGRNW